jgi:gluconokinase
MLQIQANIFGTPIDIPKNYEGSSVGAAALAFRAIDMFSSFDPVSALIPIEKTYHPNDNASKTYNEEYIIFKKIYQQLKSIF